MTFPIFTTLALFAITWITTRGADDEIMRRWSIKPTDANQPANEKD